MSTSRIIYRIDASHRITFVNEEWDRFAKANAGEKLTSEKIIGSLIWDFVSDPTTESIYRELLQTLVPGDPVSFPFRCDSPERKRQLRMTIRLLADRVVEFDTETLSVTLETQKHLRGYPPGTRTGAVLNVCSWCKKICSDGRWLDIESALKETRIFEEGSMPDISHGMCEDCYLKMNDYLARRRSGIDEYRVQVSMTS